MESLVKILNQQGLHARPAMEALVSLIESKFGEE